MNLWTNIKKPAIAIFSIVLVCGLLYLGISNRFWVQRPPSCSGRAEICNRETMELFSNRGTGTDEDPYVIENQNFNKELHIEVCCAQFAFTIQNCTFQDCNLFLHDINRSFGGGTSYHPKDVKILNNSFRNGSLWIILSDIQEVANNTFSDSTFGLYVQMAYVENLINNGFDSSCIKITMASNWDSYYTVFSNFENNTIDGLDIGFFDNEDNITISTSYSQLFIYNSTSVSIVNQSISNSVVGLTIGYCSVFLITKSNFTLCETAIKISKSSKGTITNNTLKFNNIGVVLGADNSTIRFNLISDSQSYGILNHRSDFCHVRYNNFVNNSLEEISQAFDGSEHSDWDINYWSDWIGTGNYQIAGYGPVYLYDDWPLSNPIEL